MNTNNKNAPRLSAVAAVVASVLSMGAVAGTFNAVPVDIGPSLTHQYEKSNNFDPLLEQQLPTYYIIQLEDAPLATYSGGVKGLAPTNKQAYNSDKLQLSSVQATAYGQYLASKQQAVVTALQSKFPQLQIERNLQVTLNGLIVKHPDTVDIKAQLQSIPGVKQVFEHELFYTQMDTSLDLINAPDGWAKLGGRSAAGAGVKVAIIDGGIRPDHPMFASNGHVRPSGLPTDDYCATVDIGFCNDKLVLARYYTPTFAVHASEHISPRDMGGHGTHVAGTAVGNTVVGTYNNVEVEVSGVAPGATLMVYKALFQTPAGRGSGSNIMLVGALEDAVADGADIINNSWGGSPGTNPANSVYTPIFAAAEAAGVMIVTAAGNDGPGATTIGCPGCAEPGLTVASTQSGRTFGHKVDAAGINDIAALPGTGNFSITADITGVLVPSGSINPANIEGCSPFPAGSLKDKIVLLPRGTCAFTDKANNAAAAEAKGMILYNNQAGVISMSMPGVTLPSVSITQQDGLAILAAWEEGDTATISKAMQLMNPAAVDAMSSFSSRGPNGDSSFLKPDIAAPGSDILSAAVSPTATFAINSGTSMASPHVAGAAALIRQQRPDLDAFQVKSILMTSSNPAIKKEDLATVATPFDRGAGRLDVEAATNTAIAFDKASLVSTGCAVTCSFERKVTNLMPEDGHWQGHVEFANDKVTGSLSTTDLALAAEGSANFKVHVNTSYADEGWQFGQVVWTDASGKYAPAHLPIAVMAKRSDNTQLASTMLMSNEVKAGVPFRMQSRGGHTGAREFVSFTVRVPEGANLVGSPTVSESNATRTGFSVAPNGRNMAWAGAMTGTAASAAITAGNFPGRGLSLVDLGLASNSLPCEAGCDEVSWNFQIGNFGGFIWNGQQVSTMTISDNGFITAASQSTNGAWQNQQLPSTVAPNAVIAPLWADYAVGGADGGNIYYNIVNDGTNDWFVWEWNNVREYASTTNNRYTFAVWIKLGTNEVYLNYVNVPTLPTASTVGIEDITGTLGAVRYYNGTGTAPTAGQAFRALLTPASSAAVTVNYSLQAPFGKAEAINATVVRGESVEIDLSDKFATETMLLSHVTTSSPAGTYQASQPMYIAAAEGEMRVKVVDSPMNGQVTAVTTGDVTEPLKLVYTPNALAENDAVFTSDSFTYVIEDSEGGTSSLASVAITVNEPNRAPVAAATISAARVKEGQAVTLNASGSTDPDGDALTYTWTQTAGPAVTLTNATSAQASFTSPVLTTDTTLSFTVTVSDGDLTSQATVSVVVEANKAPVAAAAASASRVTAGQSVTLNASGSSDPDGNALTYSWTQTAGPAAPISNANTATASFTAPELGADTTLTFAVTVSDGRLTNQATVSVTVEAHKKSSKKWYEGSFSVFMALLALPFAILRRRQR